MSLKQLPLTFSICEALQLRINDDTLKKTERTKSRLMKSMAELLDNQSLKDIRNTDLSANAGVSYGVLNMHFKDKVELAMHLLQYFINFFQIEFKRHKDTLVEEEDVYLRLFSTVYFHMQCCQRNIGLYRLLLVESDNFVELEPIFPDAIYHWSNEDIILPPGRIADIILDKEETNIVGVLIGGMLNDAVRYFLLRPVTSAKYSIEKLTLLVTVLRYRAMFGKDPTSASLKKVDQLILLNNHVA